MLFILSPAKKLDTISASSYPTCSNAEFLASSAKLVDILRKKTPNQLSELMLISDKLAVLNAGRYNAWQVPFTVSNAKQAIFAFKGDVYVGLDAQSLSETEINYLQQNLRILSGLYGVLRPLDLIQAYRLEMGCQLQNTKGKNLYEFWADTITNALNSYLKAQQIHELINLASMEYSAAIDMNSIKASVITPIFKDKKNNQYKTISFYAKRTRGMMVRWAAKHNICDAEQLKDFNCDGYVFDIESSGNKQWIFCRG